MRNRQKSGLPAGVKLVERAAFVDAATTQAGSSGLALRKEFAAELRAVNEAARTIDFVISTAAVDRYRDTIAVDGWQLDNYMKSPVVLWCHDASLPPIGRAQSVTKSDSALLSTAEFMPRELSPFADSIFRMYAARYLSAVSVGFLPLDYDWANDDAREFGIDFKAQELLEYSCCAIPANPEALIAAKAGGIDTGPLREWAERILDTGGSLIVPRAAFEAFAKAAKMPAANGVRRDGMEEEDPAAGGAGVDDDAAPPTGNCGRAPDEACGMQDPAECAVHAPALDGAKQLQSLLGKMTRQQLRCCLAIAHVRAAGHEVKTVGGGLVEKAGRVLSAANEADLLGAVGLIEGVLAQVAPEASEEEEPGPGPGEASALPPSLRARRLREVDLLQSAQPA